MKTDRQIVQDALPARLLMRAAEAIDKVFPDQYGAKLIHDALDRTYQENLRGLDPLRLQAVHRRIERAVKEVAAPFAQTQATLFAVAVFRLVRLIMVDQPNSGAIVAAIDAMDRVVAQTNWDPDGTAAVTAQNIYRTFQQNGLFAPRP